MGRHFLRKRFWALGNSCHQEEVSGGGNTVAFNMMPLRRRPVWAEAMGSVLGSSAEAHGDQPRALVPGVLWFWFLAWREMIDRLGRRDVGGCVVGRCSLPPFQMGGHLRPYSQAPSKTGERNPIPRTPALWLHSCLRPLPQETVQVTNSLGPQASHKSEYTTKWVWE